MRNTLVRRAATAAAVAVAGAALVAFNALVGDAPGTVALQASYHLDTSLDAMVTYPTNRDVIRGRVVAVEPARWNTPDGKRPAPGYHPAYIFTPVRVMVDTVLRGDGSLQGREIVVRRYDGRVGDVAFASEHGRVCALLPDQEVVLFLTEAERLRDGRTDRVANAAYAVRQDSSLVGVDGARYGTVADLHGLLGLSLPALPGVGHVPSGCGAATHEH